MSCTIMVEVKGLSKSYGRKTILKDLSLTIYKGEIFGLLGPNGAGKSTFISILTSVSRPTAGEIYIDSINIRRQPDKIKQQIGFVPQDVALYPMLSALDNLDFWAGIYGLKGPEKKDRIIKALETVRLEDRAKDRVEHYSGGMKRRLNIAVALLHHPEILVMDEPTVGVDIQSRRLILETLSNLKKEGKTIILASHYMNEVEELCDRLAVINEGEIKITGTPDEIRRYFSAGSMEEVMLKLME